MRTRLIWGIVLIGLSNAVGLAEAPHVDPSAWVGHSWPPTKKTIQCEADLSKGHWLVVLYNSGCSHCQALAEAYTSAVKDVKSTISPLKLALIDINPPNADPSSLPPPPNVTCGQLLDLNLYPGQPVTLLLNDGQVVWVRLGWETADLK